MAPGLKVTFPMVLFSPEIMPLRPCLTSCLNVNLASWGTVITSEVIISWANDEKTLSFNSALSPGNTGSNINSLGTVEREPLATRNL